jgi:hypothetical protein
MCPLWLKFLQFVRFGQGKKLHAFALPCGRGGFAFFEEFYDILYKELRFFAIFINKAGVCQSKVLYPSISFYRTGCPWLP